jgi:selenocysteine lyase/cysteine desulfurase
MSCKEFGILSFIDGAHGVGHIDLSHLGTLQPDFMTSLSKSARLTVWELCF